MNDPVNNPDHYTYVNGVECIEVTENFNFNRGNAIKYIWRAGFKGDVIQDLAKARWYIEREMDRLERIRSTEESGEGWQCLTCENCGECDCCGDL